MAADVLRQRQAIETEIAGRTLAHWMLDNATMGGGAPALSWRGDHDDWQTLSWAAFREEVARVALGLADLGVEAGDTVAIMAGNRPEHVIADLAALHLGAVPSTFYGTLAGDQIRYAADNCGAVAAILEGRDELKRWNAVRGELPALAHLVLLDEVDEPGVTAWSALVDRGSALLATDEGRDRFEAAWQAVTPEDPATLIYTSGTTGPPKGVILTHRNCMYETIALDHLAKMPDELSTISYLPLAHIAERLITIYIPLRKRGHVSFCPDPSLAIDTVRAARPSFFFGVPRVWEKVRAGITAQLEETHGIKQRLAEAAVATGRKMVTTTQAGRDPGLALRLRHRVLDRLVLAKIREGIGLDECLLPASAAAPLPVDVASFFHAIGIGIVEVYGMTETTGVATGNRPGAVRLGTVGAALEGVEVRLADDGEILVRGPNCTPGYRGRPDADAELFADDGWIRTGDIGSFDDDGNLAITDRKKELIVTAGGKNISPANIEAMLKEHPLVGQALVYGDARPYITALIVLDGEVAPAWATSHGITEESTAALAQDPQVLTEIERAVQGVNERLARVEQVKRYAVLPTEWTAESEELTPTLKIKRRVVHDKYAHDIAALYE